MVTRPTLTMARNLLSHGASAEDSRIILDHVEANMVTDLDHASNAVDVAISEAYSARPNMARLRLALAGIRVAVSTATARL